MKRLTLLPVAALVGVALFAAHGYDASACGGPCPTATPVKTSTPVRRQTPYPTRPPRTATPVATRPPAPTATPDERTHTECRGDQLFTIRNRDGYPLSQTYSPSCIRVLVPPPPVVVPPATVISYNTYCASGLLYVDVYYSDGRSVHNSPGGCPVVNPPRVQPVVAAAAVAPCCTYQSGSFTTTSQVAGVRVSPPSTGSGGLR